jgi:hypothetical protein
MTKRLRWRLLTTVAACVLAAPLLAQKPNKEPAIKPGALAKMAEPWPDAETMNLRRVDAEKRRLFAENDAFPFTLTADFKAINKDRSTEGKKHYPALLTMPGDGSRPTTLHVTLRTRGHFRLRPATCGFVPLRVEFNRDEAEGTIFDRQKALKLVTHCQSDKEYEQYTLREYLVYRALNLLTPRSFRARLARATYVQESDGKTITTRFGMFLEDDDDVARRSEGRVMELPRALFKDVDQDALTLMMMFEYMIGNTDFSIYALHNVRLVSTPAKTVFAVPYDFDLSGLVNTSYALPERALGIRSVRDRLYRGPCRGPSEIAPVLEQFRAHKQEIFALYDSLPELDPPYRREARSYLDEFFRSIDRAGDVKSIFIDGQCSKKSTM